MASETARYRGGREDVRPWASCARYAVPPLRSAPAMRLSAVSSCSSPFARLGSVSAWTRSPFRGVPCRLTKADGEHAGTSRRMAREHRASGRWGAEIRPPPPHGAGPKLPELEACEGRGPGACGHRMLPFPRADRRPQRIIPDISGLASYAAYGIDRLSVTAHGYSWRRLARGSQDPCTARNSISDLVQHLGCRTGLTDVCRVFWISGSIRLNARRPAMHAGSQGRILSIVTVSRETLGGL